MVLREELCFAVARLCMKPPVAAKQDEIAYQAWRDHALAEQWGHFDDADIRDKDVLDLGCGYGALSFYLARRGPRQITAVDLDGHVLQKAEERRTRGALPGAERIRFVRGLVDGLPVPPASIDTIVAFDMLEHVMEPGRLLEACARALRPGGKLLIWWSPFRGPWGPHMDELVRIPWAHVIFGERALFSAASRIYEHASFVPRPWDLDENGKKRPNKWRSWSSFAEQGYLNQLTVPELERLLPGSGLEIARFEPHGFGGPPLRRALGSVLVKLPVVGEYMTSFIIAELQRPALSNVVPLSRAAA